MSLLVDTKLTNRIGGRKNLIAAYDCSFMSPCLHGEEPNFSVFIVQEYPNGVTPEFSRKGRKYRLFTMTDFQEAVVTGVPVAFSGMFADSLKALWVPTLSEASKAINSIKVNSEAVACYAQNLFYSIVSILRREYKAQAKCDLSEFVKLEQLEKAVYYGKLFNIAVSGLIPYENKKVLKFSREEKEFTAAQAFELYSRFERYYEVYAPEELADYLCTLTTEQGQVYLKEKQYHDFLVEIYEETCQSSSGEDCNCGTPCSCKRVNEIIDDEATEMLNSSDPWVRAQGIYDLSSRLSEEQVEHLLKDADVVRLALAQKGYAITKLIFDKHPDVSNATANYIAKTSKEKMSECILKGDFSKLDKLFEDLGITDLINSLK